MCAVVMIWPCKPLCKRLSPLESASYFNPGLTVCYTLQEMLHVEEGCQILCQGAVIVCCAFAYTSLYVMITEASQKGPEPGSMHASAAAEQTEACLGLAAMGG